MPKTASEPDLERLAHLRLFSPLATIAATAQAWIPERSATRLREADLDVLSKLGKQGFKGVLNPRHLRGVRLVVRTISWISRSDVRSISRYGGSHHVVHWRFRRRLFAARHKRRRTRWSCRASS